MSYPLVQLKAGREASVGFHHPWIFSGALDRVAPEAVHGGLVHVTDRQGRIIGTGTFSDRSTIAVRVFDFKEVVIDKSWFIDCLKRAHGRRIAAGYGPDTATTGYRVVFGEADYLPGLVVDRYHDVLVLQLSTAGMDALRPPLLAACEELWAPAAIVERSDMAIRQEEGLEKFTHIHKGEVSQPVAFSEHGLKFVADVLGGQKTGFFLDQKNVRLAVQQLAHNKTILNLFSYTGATSIAALKGGARVVHNIDESAAALALLKQQVALNDLPPESCQVEAADVFSWLNTHSEERYDMVIVDPPALMKNRRDKEAAGKAYHFLNRAAMRLVQPGGIFVTSSCSRYFTEEDLAFTLRRASVQAGVTLDVVRSMHQAPDHPLSVYFPESFYLKSFIALIYS